MQNPIFTDFTAGELSPKLSGRTDLAVYKKGCETLKNFQPMTQGGIKRRPGSQYIADIPNQVRLISFVVDDTHAFLIEFSNLQLRIWWDDELIEFTAGDTTETAPYTTEELDEIHHVQSYDRIFFTHQNHSIRQLIYSGGTFTWGELSITVREGQTIPFQSTGEYPKTCAIISGRLWLASSTNQPATVWGSRPFDSLDPTNYGDFTDKDIIETTTIEYTDPTGWADPAVPEYEEVTTEDDSITYSHAIEITLGSDRNEEIMWIAGQQDIVVGTMTGEYIIPGNINALEQRALPRSRHGSAPIRAKLVDAAVLFIQSGKKKIREYYYASAEGAYKSPDLTWASDHILQDEVRDFDFQRTPDPRVYCVLANGDLKVLSYSRMYDVVGWAQWETEGAFEQVCILDTPSGEDVYLVVTREGTRRLEKLYEPYSDSYMLDCANEITTDGTGTPSYPFASAEWNLFDDDMNLVETPEADTTYTAGFIFTSDLVLNRINVGGRYGTSQTNMKRITELRARIVSSYAFSAGYKDRLFTCASPTSGYPYTGDIRIPLSGEYNTDAQIEIKTTSHRPLMITAIVPDVGVN